MLGWNAEEIQHLKDSEINLYKENYGNEEAWLVYAENDEGAIPLAVAVEDQINYSINLDIEAPTIDESLEIDSEHVIETFYKHPMVSKSEYQDEINGRINPEKPTRQRLLDRAAKRLKDEDSDLREVKDALSPKPEEEPKVREKAYL